VLLHTEVMREHLLVSEGPGGAWRLTGLIDFEPAMRGEREYEFVGVGVFVAEGDARFLAGTLASYGYDRDQLGPDLRRRLLAWGILHRSAISGGGCSGCRSHPTPHSMRSPTAGSRQPDHAQSSLPDR
jgi:hygromycin-B 7''-O-kinase